MSRDGFANCSSPDTPPCAGARPRRASVDAFSQSAAIETAIDHAQSDAELKIEQLGGHFLFSSQCSQRIFSEVAAAGQFGLPARRIHRGPKKARTDGRRCHTRG